jgi:hypothetical protein
MIDEVSFLIPEEPICGKPRSPKWTRFAKEYLSKNSFCRCCGSTRFLVPHHIIPYWVDSSKELDWDNLITLCETPALNCHLFIGHLKLFQSWNPDVVEDCRRLLEKIKHRPMLDKTQTDALITLDNLTILGDINE